jgi:membrane peptidoglycan carboxypeptidase
MTSAGGAAERLAELNRMLDAGLITQSEYDAKKSEILAEL